MNPESRKGILSEAYGGLLRIEPSCILRLSVSDTVKTLKWKLQDMENNTLLVVDDLPEHIPLSDRAIEIVEKHIKGKFPSEFVFINPVTGKGYLPETLSKYWKLHSGIDVSYYEASRHSFCTQIVEDCNVNEFQAQLLTRHADPRSTRRYFTETLRDCGTS